MGIQQTSFRAAVESTIGTLIDLLDRIDGDPDFEPNLSAPVPTFWLSQALWAEGADDDREESCEDEGFDSDREASLCGVTFGSGLDDDREGDGEPFLMDQRRTA